MPRKLKEQEMVDITAPEIVHISMRDNGSVVWVNVNNRCVLRCCQIKNLQIEIPGEKIRNFSPMSKAATEQVKAVCQKLKELKKKRNQKCAIQLVEK